MSDIHVLSVAANSIDGANYEEEDQKVDPHNCLKTRLAANVHTRQVNPLMTEEEWHKMECTRKWLKQQNKENPFHLSRSDLLPKNTFEKEWHKGLYDFLDSAPKPACLVAYNGLKFDFRVFLCELRRCKNFFSKHFIPSELFLVDAYLAFLDIEKVQHDELERTVNSINWTITRELTHSMSERKRSKDEEKVAEVNYACVAASFDVKMLTLDGTPTLMACPTPVNVTPEKEIEIINESMIKKTNGTIPNSGTNRNLNSIYDMANHDGIFKSSSHVTLNNCGNSSLISTILQKPEGGTETPTKKQCLAQHKSNSEPKQMNATNAYICNKIHPLSIIVTSHWPPAIKRRIRNDYFQRKNNGSWTFNSQNYRYQRGNFKLKNLYRQIIRDNFDAHRAQDDTEALLQLCLAYGDKFVQYADAHRFSFPKGAVESETNQH